MTPKDIAIAFAAGAYSAAVEDGMAHDKARAFAAHMCKRASLKMTGWNSDDGENEETWFDRNKSWVIPTAIGLGAFWLGADAGRKGRLDEDYLPSVWSLLKRRTKKLFRIDDPVFDSMTRGYRGDD